LSMRVAFRGSRELSGSLRCCRRTQGTTNACCGVSADVRSTSVVSALSQSETYAAEPTGMAGNSGGEVRKSASMATSAASASRRRLHPRDRTRAHRRRTPANDRAHPRPRRERVDDRDVGSRRILVQERMAQRVEWPRPLLRTPAARILLRGAGGQKQRAGAELREVSVAPA
jgi:hypothetical protein